VGKCDNGRKPDLKGRKARYKCRSCGQKARRKKDLCKAKKL
jgi:hypothetical protein